MNKTSFRPLIGVPADVKEVTGQPFHAVGDKYLRAITLAADGLPFVIPAFGDPSFRARFQVYFPPEPIVGACRSINNHECGARCDANQGFSVKAGARPDNQVRRLRANTGLYINRYTLQCCTRTALIGIWWRQNYFGGISLEIYLRRKPDPIVNSQDAAVFNLQRYDRIGVFRSK